ncbi:hypothetical protein [Actinomyces radicidentis]|uniref:hypothetical protein n=1 Tax=Actinomyces radicidentis TaxID=111015 RepID=UPI0028E2B03E|nr:hypothetical protein [Actinomyces radicidentis]
MDLINTYDTVTGRRISSVPASEWSWRRRVSGAGSLTIKVPLTQEVADRDLRTELAPWRTTLAVVDSDTRRVIAAGIIYARKWDADSTTLELTCADMWDALKLRLVIDPALGGYSGGVVTGSDGAYPAPWSTTLDGALADIAAQLVRSTITAGPLPIVLPPTVGGQNTRTYQGPDLATVSQRLSELTDVIDGPEIAFVPRIADGATALSWHMLMGTPELVFGEHHWDTRRRAVPLVSLSIDEDASDMVGDAWGRGGSQDDRTVIAHYHDRWLEDAGWPLLQAADTSHTSLSDLSTLTAYTRATTVLRSRSTEVVQVKARRTDEAGYALADAVSAGDHLTLRHDDPYLGNGWIHLKVLEAAGDSGEWVTLSCRELIDDGSL